MKISFQEIGRKGITRLVNDLNWLSNSDLDSIELPEVEFHLNLMDEVTAKLKGELRGLINSPCSRCGHATRCELANEFEYIFRVGQDENLDRKEVECSEEECSTVFLEEPEIDIIEVYREQLVLAVPDKPLCSEDCKGLCVQCGTILSDDQCDCSGELSDSPFAVLKKLKK